MTDRPRRETSDFLRLLTPCAEGAMHLHRILHQLHCSHPDKGRATELGQLGFIEWLSLLPGDSDFHRCAMVAHAQAAPLRRASVSVAVFCDLLTEATRMPPTPLRLNLPKPHRRGGAKARRQLH